MGTTLKDKLCAALESMVKIVKPRDRTNAGPYLFDIWVYQEMCAFAEAKLKAAWKVAQDNGVISDDDTLRLAAGETIVAESDKFSCVATVAAPGERFDKDVFIAKLAKKFKLEPSDIEAVMENSKLTNKAALTKRVLEA